MIVGGKNNLPPFHCGRDHDAGPGEWCVFGPRPFKLPVPDRVLGEAIAAMMSGEWDKAKDFMKDVAIWDGEIVRISKPGVAEAQLRDALSDMKRALKDCTS